MAGVLRALVAAHPDAPVFYITALPGGFTGVLTGLLDQDGYLPGMLVPTGRGRFPWWIVGGGDDHKLAALERVVGAAPLTRWVLVGDDGGAISTCTPPASPGTPPGWR